MDIYKREYPLFSLCGLNCGLCPRFHTEGKSKCPGCGGAQFHLKHPSCSVIRCSQKNGGIQFCFECDQFPCQKYQHNSPVDSFITYQNVICDLNKGKENLSLYKQELERKVELLNDLLNQYNNGRMKQQYCLAMNLLSIEDIEAVLAEAKATESFQTADQKERSEIISKIVHQKGIERGISFQLRRE